MRLNLNTEWSHGKIIETAIKAIMAFQIVVLLMPASLLYTLGLTFSLMFLGVGLATLFQRAVTEGWQVFDGLGGVLFNEFSLFMLISGYGLVAAWWLVAAGYLRTPIRLVPAWIWLGAGFGGVLAILIASPLNWNIEGKAGSYMGLFWFKSLFGLGPLIVVISATVWVRYNSRQIPTT